MKTFEKIVSLIEEGDHLEAMKLAFASGDEKALDLFPTKRLVDLIVTRHEALREYLEEQGYVVLLDECVVSQVTADDVRDKVVAGVLPLHLAAEAREIINVDLRVPPELRGKELTIEQMRELEPTISRYRVEKID